MARDMRPLDLIPNVVFCNLLIRILLGKEMIQLLELMINTNKIGTIIGMNFLRVDTSSLQIVEKQPEKQQLRDLINGLPL